MTSGRWPEIERLYHAALERPPDARAAFLIAACGGDDDLRREVESLLRHDSAGGAFLEQPAVQDAANRLARAARVPQPPAIAGYRVMRQLGEGGMGVVYLAEQELPFRRLVALKLIRSGMDSRQVLARFEVERQALALMDHPNIAAVYDAGTTSDGRPYVAMEYVEGVPITTHCDRERLSTRARLDLFITVCAAVQHAHQKGVIHRDLKPSNVLISVPDGHAVPKVIDFGTAKATEASGAAVSPLTEFGVVLGTLEYMSPEQAALSRDIDTSTDVYSLGVLLYELLVGTVPFQRRGGTDSYDEIRRQIREADPIKPSSRLTTSGGSAQPIADARQTDLTGLVRQVKGDLDAIVLKALEKDRRHRYPTVAALAADLRRFLADEPVEARPPSTAGRVVKFARRHRGPVIAGAALLLTLVGGLAASTMMYLRAERERIDADHQRAAADEQRTIANSAKDLAEQQRNAADRAAAETRVANDEAVRQGEVASREAATARDALREVEYRAYVSTIAAADGELRANQPRDAQARLLTVPASLRGWEWQHLYLRTDTSLATLTASRCAPDGSLAGHARARTDVLLLAGSGHLYWSHCDKLDRWDPTTQALQSTVAPDFTRILTVDAAGRMVVLAAHGPDAWSLRLIHPGAPPGPALGPFPAEPACVEISPDGTRLAVGFDPPDSPIGEPLDDVFEVWNLGTGRLIARVNPPRPPQFDTRARFYTSCLVRFSPDGRRLASSGARVHVWDAASGAEFAADEVQAGRNAQPIAFNREGSLLAIGRPTGLVDVMTLAASGNSNSEKLIRLDGAGLIQPLAVREGDRRLVVGPRLKEETAAMAFAAHGSWVVSAFDTRLAIWDLEQRRLLRILEGHQGPITAVRVSADDRLIYSGDAGGTLRVWAAARSIGVIQLPGDFHMRAMTLSAEGGVAAVGGSDGSLTLWRLDDSQPVLLKRGIGRMDVAGSSVALAVSTDGRHLLSSSNEGKGRVQHWIRGTNESDLLRFNDDIEPRCQRPSNRPGGVPARQTPVAEMAFSRDGRYVAFAHGVCIGIWDMSRMETVARIPAALKPGEHTNFQSMLFRPDGKLVTITGHADTFGPEAHNIVRVWDWRSGRAVSNADTPTGAIGVRNWRLAISGDGTRIVIYGGLSAEIATRLGYPNVDPTWPMTISVWDGMVTREINRVTVRMVESVALSHDGTRMATANGFDRVVRVWDTDRLLPLLTLTNVDGHSTGVAFTRDGRLVAARTSGGLTIWESAKPSR